MTLDTQSILFAIQDLTVHGSSYGDAIVSWTLDEGKPFTALVDTDPLTDLGIALPTGSETGGHSITGFSVSAQGVGFLASGDIDARSGVLREIAELVTLECI